MATAAHGQQSAMLMNPTHPVHWPDDPQSLQELEEKWIPETKKNLLEWLGATIQQAEVREERDEIHKLEQDATREWQKWKPSADLETGFLPEDAKQEMQKSVRPIIDNISATHEKLHTWHTHTERRYAEAAWEDFLYYQNVWNRRGSFTTAQLQNAKDAATLRREETARPTPGKSTWLQKRRVGHVMAFYLLWRDHMIGLYARYQVGSRKNAPAVLGPEVAHRYSKPPRGTTPLKLEDYRRRQQRLEIQFPREKPAVESYELEDEKLTAKEMKDAIQKHEDLREERSLVEISWTLDQGAFAREQAKCEERLPESPRPRSSSPKDHVLHHGVLETSFDWPTSFDAEGWGNVIAVTASKRKYMYEEEDHKASDGQTTKRYSTNATGRPIRARETCGYKKAKRSVQIDVFNHLLSNDGSVKGQNADGSWIGQPGKADGTIYTYELKDGERVPDVRYRSRNEFKTVVLQSKWPRITRYQRHFCSLRGGVDANGDRLVDQLSDAEETGECEGNAHSGRAANARACLRGVGTKAREEERFSAGNPESDDEGDLFAESYRAGSGWS